MKQTTFATSYVIYGRVAVYLLLRVPPTLLFFLAITGYAGAFKFKFYLMFLNVCF